MQEVTDAHLDMGIAAMEKDKPVNRNLAAGLGGVAVVGALITGLAGLIIAAYVMIEKTDPVGAAQALVASALAYGFLCNAIMRE